MRISDWSSDVCSSDLTEPPVDEQDAPVGQRRGIADSAATVRCVEEADRRRAGLGRIAGIEQSLAPAQNNVGIFRTDRSEERRVGKGCCSTCSTRCAPYPEKQNYGRN